MSNISSLISPGILNTLNSTGLPNAFGDQVKETAKKKIISAALGQTQILQQKLEDIIKKKLELEITHKANLKKLDSQYIPGKPEKSVLTEEEYNVAVVIENARYEVEKELLNKQQQDTENQIQSITKDPKIKRKLESLKYKTKIKRDKVKNKANRSKATKNLLKSTAKSAAPLLMYSSIIIISKLVRENNKLKELVDQTNEIIDNASTPEQLDNARVSRNSAYNILTNNEQNLINIQNKLELITLLVSIITITSNTILFSISSPGTPASAYAAYDKAVRLLDLLNVILLALLAVLDPIISYLNELKLQLKEIDNKLDLETINANSLDNLNALLNSIKQPKDEIYKGFKLKIKEDQDPRTFVKDSIKRHYAVALDKYNVEVIKSNYSYTLEPQILIDQLKIIIDQQNLQA
jgi:hypothetical protein